MDMFHIGLFDPRWSLPSKLDDGPFGWVIVVNGRIMDVRRMPLEIQEEALRRGLIARLP